MPSTGRWAVKKKRNHSGQITQHNVYNVITHARHYDVSAISKSVRACINGLGTPLLHVVDPAGINSAEVVSEEPEASQPADDAADPAYVPGGVIGSNPAAGRPANTRRSARQGGSGVACMHACIHAHAYLHACNHACVHAHIHVLADSVLGTR